MSEEQKAAAVERLAKARAARQAANPPKYANIHNSVLELDENDPLSLKSVRAIIKYNREKIAAERKNLRMGDKHALARIASLEGYVRNLNAYLATGAYLDMFYGNEQESRTQGVCLTMAYDSNGFPKRTVGVFYPDMGAVWTHEMDVEHRKNNF